MAAKKVTKPDVVEPTVRIRLPELAEGDNVKADQTETVVYNGKTIIIQRGVPVDVAPEIYILLRNKYAYL